jgi:hypothetical protein
MHWAASNPAKTKIVIRNDMCGEPSAPAAILTGVIESTLPVFLHRPRQSRICPAIDIYLAENLRRAKEIPY